MNNQDYISIISTTLSNIYDWESDDLELDFAEFIEQECSGISKQQAIELFRKFDQISPMERGSITFDFDDFISQNIS